MQPRGTQFNPIRIVVNLLPSLYFTCYPNHLHAVCHLVPFRHQFVQHVFDTSNKLFVGSALCEFFQMFHKKKKCCLSQYL